MTDHPDMSEPAEARDRNALSLFEQMADAQAGCVPCKLCGGKAVISDAGPGSGYYVRCENSREFRPWKGCLISDRRLGGWAYNVMDWWNRLHAEQHSASVPDGWAEAIEQAAKVAEEYPHSHSKPIGESIAKRIRALSAVPPAPAADNAEGQASPEFLRRVMRQGWETAEAPHDAPGLADPAPAPRDDPDHGKLAPGHVCKHGIRWPHPCADCDSAAWEAHKAAPRDEVRAQLDVEWEVWAEEMVGETMVASSSSEADARHYLAVYHQDGPVRLVRAETTRVEVASLPANPTMARETDQCPTT